jgi:hypothetical protein
MLLKIELRITPQKSQFSILSAKRLLGMDAAVLMLKFWGAQM